MTKFNASIVTVAAALLMSGTAMAATFPAASGMQPLFDQTTSTASTLTRAQVEAEAVASLPAAGETPFVQQVAAGDPPSTLTRAQVEAEAAANYPAAGQMNGWAVNDNAQNVNPAQAGMQNAESNTHTLPGNVQNAS